MDHRGAPLGSYPVRLGCLGVGLAPGERVSTPVPTACGLRRGQGLVASAQVPYIYGPSDAPNLHQQAGYQSPPHWPHPNNLLKCPSATVPGGGAVVRPPPNLAQDRSCRRWACSLGHPSLSLQHKDPISVASAAGTSPSPVSPRAPACPVLPLTPHGCWALWPGLLEGGTLSEPGAPPALWWTLVKETGTF